MDLYLSPGNCCLLIVWGMMRSNALMKEWWCCCLLNTTQDQMFFNRAQKHHDCRPRIEQRKFGYNGCKKKRRLNIQQKTRRIKEIFLLCGQNNTRGLFVCDTWPTMKWWRLATHSMLLSNIHMQRIDYKLFVQSCECRLDKWSVGWFVQRCFWQWILVVGFRLSQSMVSGSLFWVHVLCSHQL